MCVQAGNSPSTRSLGIFLSCLFAFSLPFIPWIILVGLFRTSYIQRFGPNGGPKFLLFWSKMKRYLQVCSLLLERRRGIVLPRTTPQRISLFFLTVLYMPSSKVILRTFAPSVDEAVLGNDCPYRNSANQTCCLLIEPTKPCIGSRHWEELTQAQALSIPFLIVYVFRHRCCAAVMLHFLTREHCFSYVIMVPLFFVWLVKRGVHEVYVGGYRHRMLVRSSAVYTA